jgi:hypothetical protein
MCLFVASFTVGRSSQTAKKFSHKKAQGTQQLKQLICALSALLWLVHSGQKQPNREKI